MDCPNGHGEMENFTEYIVVGDFGTEVVVFICQECAYAEAEAI